MRLFVLFVMLLVMVACSSVDAALPISLTAEPTEVVQALPPTVTTTLVATAHMMPSSTSTLPPTETVTPSATVTPTPTSTPTLTPSSTFTPSPTLTPSLTLTPLPSATPLPSPTLLPTEIPIRLSNRSQAEATWTPPPLDAGAMIVDHYYLSRPIAQDGVNWVDRTYPYASTAGGRYRPHHGVEFVNPAGTPIKAAAEGVVLYAGDDFSTLWGPQNNFYGNLVVLRHNFPSPEGQPVHSVYAHMSAIFVTTGQVVAQGEQLGSVGATGVAQGPHLHFEVRVGNPYNYNATRNPELWLRPYPGYGTIAGRVVDSAGNILQAAPVRVESSQLVRYAYSYIGDTVNPDPALGENVVVGDLPAGWYEVTVGESGRTRFRQTVYVHPNRTTFVEMTLR